MRLVQSSSLLASTSSPEREKEVLTHKRKEEERTMTHGTLVVHCQKEVGARRKTIRGGKGGGSLSQTHLHPRGALGMWGLQPHHQGER